MENITLNNQDYANISSVVYDKDKNLATSFANDKKATIEIPKRCTGLN